jgi:hypothetical protein
MVPFAKLQAAPLAVVAFLAIFLCAWRIHAMGFQTTLVTMTAGGLIAPAAMVITLLATATFNDAWRSYVITGLQISSQRTDLCAFAHFVLGCPQLTATMALQAAIVLAGINIRFLRQQIQGEGRWFIAGSIAYGLATIYAIYKAGARWEHHLLFGLPAVVLLATALFAPSHISSPWQRAWSWLGSAIRPSGAVIPITFLLSIVVFGILPGRSAVLERVDVQNPDRIIGKVILALLKEDSHFAVWGYMPQYYAMSGKRPSTREVITQFQAWEGPQRDYYRRRYMVDFNGSRPNVVVDADPADDWGYSPYMPVESFRELNDIIRSNYVLFLDIQCGRRRTRIFVSRMRLSEIDAEMKPFANSSACLAADY